MSKHLGKLWLRWDFEYLMTRRVNEVDGDDGDEKLMISAMLPPQEQNSSTFALHINFIYISINRNSVRA